MANEKENTRLELYVGYTILGERTRELGPAMRFILLLSLNPPILIMQSSFWPAFIYPPDSGRHYLKSPKIVRLFDTRPIFARIVFFGGQNGYWYC